ncbi:MAG: 2-amino-4-hydroxy-6-hydroxymethyldihydropteridine diphosphokinase [Alphaproteobacteria bacterium]
MTRCLIAMGSNLGDRLAHLTGAVAAIADDPAMQVLAVSALYETAPVGGPGGQDAFLNTALLAETEAGPSAVLSMLQRIEQDHARERSVHWGPRTLDLDLLTYGGTLSDEADLELPHPRMHERRFVMVPVCDLAPEMVHPRLGRTMRDLLEALPAAEGDLVESAHDWVELRTVRAAAL